MGTTVKYGLRWPAGADGPAGHTQIKNLAEDVEGLIDGLPVAELEHQDPAELLVANASGVIVGTALSGDVTMNASGVVTIGNDKVSDAKLVSPNNAAYKTLLTAESFLSGNALAGTYLLGSGLIAVAGAMRSAASYANTAVGAPPAMRVLDDAYYAVAGRATKLRLQSQVCVDGTNSAINFTFGLYPLTAVGGGANAISYTVGTLISGSTTTHTAPTSGSGTIQTGSDFSFPADGKYLLCCLTSGDLAPSSLVSMHAQLEIRHV